MARRKQRLEDKVKGNGSAKQQLQDLAVELEVDTVDGTTSTMATTATSNKTKVQADDAAAAFGGDFGVYPEFFPAYNDDDAATATGGGSSGGPQPMIPLDSFYDDDYDDDDSTTKMAFV